MMNIPPYKILGDSVFLHVMLTCIRAYVTVMILFSHLRSCAKLYNSCSYLTMATATASITDSTAQYSTLDKAHKPVNYNL